jgi:hypothetical protein
VRVASKLQEMAGFEPTDYEAKVAAVYPAKNCGSGSGLRRRLLERSVDRMSWVWGVWLAGAELGQSLIEEQRSHDQRER